MTALTPEQESNGRLIVKSLTTFGITNQYLQAGILACAFKESLLIPKSENLNYSLNNIMHVWPQIYPDVAAKLAGNPEAIGNYMYGGRYGNSPLEGYKYRGRGFNQITFKAEYIKYGTAVKVDLVNNPDKLNEPQTAADVLAYFFLGQITAGFNSNIFAEFNVHSVEEIKDNKTGVEVAIQINAGIRTNFNNATVQDGYNRAMAEVDALFKLTIVT